MDTVVIANSSSGKGCPPEWDAQLREHFRARGIEAEVFIVHGGAQILEQAEKAVRNGARKVVACGGDGTVSAVASKVAGTQAALGVIPLGTLNHFAKDAGIPLDIDGAVDAIAAGREIRVDVAEVNGRVFVNNSSLGLYPDIVKDRDEQRQRLGRGKWMALAIASVKALRRYPLLSVTMEVDGSTLTRRTSFVFIGNNEYKMAGFEVGERARLDAGHLSLYVSQRTGRFGLLRLALRALFGRLAQASDFDSIAVSHLRVETRRPLLRVATDGEITVMRTPLDYHVRAGALRVMVPASGTSARPAV